MSYRVGTDPANPGKYLNFTLAFSRAGKSLKMVGGPGKSWKSVNSSHKRHCGAAKWKDPTTCIMGPVKKLFEAWKSSENMFLKKSTNLVFVLARY